MAVAACLAASSAVSSLVSAGRALVSTAAAYVLTGLSLFSEPKHQVQEQPAVRTHLTARERHDLQSARSWRPTVTPRWRLCPSG